MEVNIINVEQGRLTDMDYDDSNMGYLEGGDEPFVQAFGQGFSQGFNIGKGKGFHQGTSLFDYSVQSRHV